MCAFQWAEKAAAKSNATAGSSKSNSVAQTIDLTLQDDSDAEDGFEDVVMQAAPCPNCHKTFAFAEGAYEEHLDGCQRREKGESKSLGTVGTRLMHCASMQK
jgi:hypothetical protein